MDPTTVDLTRLLRERFGHEEFRPYQETVCRAATEGEDLLLVMPTGAGKSLCYQLPGIARQGTSLVVSPLIALMEDQVAKLREQGFVAERIHSGRDRLESRQVCRDYLDGKLDFLFIAPERLRVPGFPEMLAKRKPALVAVDEAHCISNWGHDFRPDYRLLGERLPLLRPSPILAMTATATVRVQRDIVEQLGIPDAHRFIHGFRRDNIAIEAVEVPPSARLGAVLGLLEDEAHRPAIVYAATRKQTEELADELETRFSAAAYHAGMPASRRDRVQSAFLEGELDVIVATIAFGMGIDKSDVRTVAHTAMPASVEGYYQEVGRAGRDGLPSRAVLLHSFADRRTLEFLLDKNYPPPADLGRVFGGLGATPRTRDSLLATVGGDPEQLDEWLDKLRIHGGAVVTREGFVRGRPDWIHGYTAQREHRLTQIAEMTRFADTHTCRMVQLVRHFGDLEDRGYACGMCDVCAPTECRALQFREPRADEREAMERILDALRQRNRATSGQLHKHLFEGRIERKVHEQLVGALVRAGYVVESRDSFEQGGRTIEFKRVHLTPRGRDARTVEETLLPVERAVAPRRRRESKVALDPDVAAAKAPPGLVEELRTFRTEQARERGVPPYCVFNDATLLNLAAACPAAESELLAVKGIGPGIVGTYGEALLEIVGRHRDG